MAGEKNKAWEDAIRETLVAGSNSESDADASNVEDYFEEEEGEEEKEEEEDEEGEEEEEEGGEEEEQKQQLQALQSRTTGCNMWLITNLGTASRNINIHPFVSPAKGGIWNCFSILLI